jgi:hypothetical protein
LGATGAAGWAAPDTGGTAPPGQVGQVVPAPEEEGVDVGSAVGVGVGRGLWVGLAEGLELAVGLELAEELGLGSGVGELLPLLPPLSAETAAASANVEVLRGAGLSATTAARTTAPDSAVPTR